MPIGIPGVRRRIISALAASTALAALLGGCASYDTTTPRSARDKASGSVSGDGAAAQTVDCRKASCVALTFDAGPSPYTPKLLDVLKQQGAHATFFMLGKNHVMKYPDTVRRLVAEGNEPANHTWTHKILTEVKPAEARAEIEQTEDAVERISGRRPVLMRPPQGRTDEDVSAICKELGVAQVLWSVTAKDYATDDSELIRKRVREQVKRDGIILLHDIYPGTVPAVPGILADLKAAGYTVVTVSQLLSPAKPEPGRVYKP
ncbi:polysaccharide deacetylase family protein [Kitasatospora sp. NBC_01539]|uniref:polysaccharide deacetylase family protein n=1 Tax=Kitasatospora sp. NBC_01539 TaxID=2903577 RepID=UPI0038601CE3